MANRWGAFLAVALLLSPGSSSAADKVLVAFHIQAPSCVSLVGSLAGIPAMSEGRFEVVVRDLANNPVASCPVVVDLSACSDLSLCTDMLDPSLVVNCRAHTVQAWTDARGVAVFTLLGSSMGGQPTTQGAKGKIYVPGYPLWAVNVAANAYDLDGAWGAGANDFSVWLTDFGSGLPWARSDYDGSGTIGANDLSTWLTVFGDGESAQSCSTRCP